MLYISVITPRQSKYHDYTYDYVAIEGSSKLSFEMSHTRTEPALTNTRSTSEFTISVN